MSGRASPYMGTLVSALFAVGAHANVSPFRVWEFVVYYCHDISQEPHTPLDLMLAFSLRIPLYRVVNALS